MTHKDAAPETASQTACREYWERAQPHVKRAWGRAKDGSFLAEDSKLLHMAWEAARMQQSVPMAELKQLAKKWRVAEAEEDIYSGEYCLGVSEGIAHCTDELENFIAEHGKELISE